MLSKRWKKANSIINIATKKKDGSAAAQLEDMGQAAQQRYSRSALGFDKAALSP